MHRSIMFQYGIGEKSQRMIPCYLKPTRYERFGFLGTSPQIPPSRRLQSQPRAYSPLARGFESGGRPGVLTRLFEPPFRAQIPHRADVTSCRRGAAVTASSLWMGIAGGGRAEVRDHTLCGFSECRAESASRCTSENHSLYRPAPPLSGSLGSGSHPTRTPPHPLHSPFPGRRREPHPDGVRLFAAADAEAFRVPGPESYSPRLGIEGCNWRMVGAERDCFTYFTFIHERPVLAVRMRNSDRRRQYAVSRRRRVESASPAVSPLCPER